MRGKFILAFVLVAILMPVPLWANGGPQNYVDGYIVAMSNSPFVPGAGERVSFIFAFVASDSYEPIRKPIKITIDISDKFDNPILENFESEIDSGYLEFDYTFPEDGMYHVTLGFTVEGEETRSTHFLSGVKSQESALPINKLLMTSGLALLFGFILGLAVPKLRK